MQSRRGSRVSPVAERLSCRAALAVRIECQSHAPAFNQCKSAVGRNALVPDDANNVLSSQRFQFSLRSMLLVVPLLAVGFAFGFAVVVLIAALAGVVYSIRTKRFDWALGIIVCLAIITLTGVGWSVQVRLDTGDQRVCYWGIPAYYRLMSPSARQALLSLDDDQVPHRWVWCATQVGSNNADAMVYRFYHDAAVWVGEDREVAKLIVRDLAAYLRKTHATKELPECTPIIWPDVIERGDDLNEATVIEGWASNPEVQRYLSTKGYSPP